MNLRSSWQIYTANEEKRHQADECYQSAHRTLVEKPVASNAEIEQSLLQALALIARIDHDIRNPNDDMLQMKCYHDLVINALNHGAGQMKARGYLLKGLNGYFNSEFLWKVHPEYFVHAAAMVIGFVSAIINTCVKSKKQLNNRGYNELFVFVKSAEDILQGVRDYLGPIQVSAEIRCDIALLYDRLICIHHELRKDDEKIAVGMRGLQVLLNVQDDERNENDFKMIAKLYVRLAQLFNNDTSYAPLFNFMSNYFSGSGQVTMSALKKMINDVNGMEPSQSHYGILMQFMRLVARTLTNELLPDSELRRELSQHYYQLAFKDLFDQQVKKEDEMMARAVQDALAILNEAKAKPIVAPKFEVKKGPVSAASMFTGKKNGKVAALARQLEPVIRFDKK